MKATVLTYDETRKPVLYEGREVGCIVTCMNNDKWAAFKYAVDGGLPTWLGFYKSEAAAIRRVRQFAKPE